MRSIKRITPYLAVPAAAIALAACGSSSSGGGGGTASTAPSGGSTTATTHMPSPASGATKLGTAKGKLGRYLVDGSGRSVYLFLADKHGKSACSGACVSSWPILAASGKPTAGPGVDASKISVITRADGKKQVRYGKYPLYYYAGDSKPGDISGQGLNQFGAPWYLVRPNGQKYDTD
jgi:predicted lipoprotein with Yx(FWY)xxD motif